MANSTHSQQHHHHHGPGCGHRAIAHNDHTDYLHDGHLHYPGNGTCDEHVIEVSSVNPEACKKIQCESGHDLRDIPRVPHGSHTDFLVDGRLHCQHDDHCDDHGPVLFA